MNRKLKFLVLTSISLLMALVFVFFACTEKGYQASVEAEQFKPTIIIDPGHGGEDSGAVSKTNILEKNINLDISLMLKEFLKSNGFEVIMTRDTDTALNDKDADHKKHSDLKNRVEVFNSSQNNIVISIHQNKFIEEKYSGTQIFYSANCENSSILAENIRTTVISLLQPDNERECKKAGSEIFVLHNAQVPAVMVECGFLSNIIEAEKLNSKAYQRKLAYCIYLGFLEYYYTNY